MESGITSRTFLIPNYSFFIILALLCSACVQTQEHTTGSLITIDYSRTYDRALTRNMATARRAAHANPKDPAPHYLLAQAALLQNDLDTAEAEFKTILNLAPDSPGAYYELARISVQRGDTEKAIEQLNSALMLKAHFAEAHFLLARIHKKLGNHEKAKKHQQSYLDALEAQRESSR